MTGASPNCIPSRYAAGCMDTKALRGARQRGTSGACPLPALGARGPWLMFQDAARVATTCVEHGCWLTARGDKSGETGRESERQRDIIQCAVCESEDRFACFRVHRPASRSISRNRF